MKTKEKIYESDVEITIENQKEWEKKLSCVTKITGYLYVSPNVTLSCDALTTIGRSLYVSSNLTLPGLTTIGSSLNVYSDVKLNIKCLRKINYKIFDNIAFLVESEKTSKGIKIYSGGNITSIKKNKSSIEKCYVAEKGNCCAHGQTVKQAILELNTIE